jgi:hypothetical protein
MRNQICQMFVCLNQVFLYAEQPNILNHAVVIIKSELAEAMNATNQSFSLVISVEH